MPSEMDTCPCCGEPIVRTEELEGRKNQIEGPRTTGTRTCIEIESLVQATIYYHPRRYLEAQYREDGDDEWTTMAQSTRLEGVDMCVHRHWSDREERVEEFEIPRNVEDDDAE